MAILEASAEDRDQDVSRARPGRCAVRRRKGANLGELARAGFPIPSGFVMGAPVYAAFAEASGLRRQFAGRLEGLDVRDATALQTAAADVRAIIEAVPLPEVVDHAIRAAYAHLGQGADAPVSVRSSATAEDTEAASFAGMNETFLNVCGPDAVVDAVRRCWWSLFGARTIFYRAEQGLPQANMDIAVVVQRQVDVDRAGVMFTVDPATGARDRIAIEGAFGLGEAVVSGRISPDRYVVDKSTLAVLAREIHPKTAVIEARPGGGTTLREVTGEEALRPTLSEDEARELAEFGRRIERHTTTRRRTPKGQSTTTDERGSCRPVR